MDHHVTETRRDASSSPRPRVSIVGAGRAGSALAVALRAAGYPITAVHSRSRDSAAHLASQVGAEAVSTASAAARAADVVLLTVPGPQVIPVAATIAATSIALPGRVVIHCDGGQGRDALAAIRLTAAAAAAMHPLQALAGEASAPLFRGSAFAVDADEGARAVVAAMVLDLGGLAFTVGREQRALYHAAAVLAGNAPLALLSAATGLLEEAGIDAAVAGVGLAALLEGAAHNARRDGVARALTGPVVRNDAASVRAHLAALSEADPRARSLYVQLGAELLEVVGRPGRAEVAAVLDEALHAEAGQLPDHAPSHATAA